MTTDAKPKTAAQGASSLAVDLGPIFVFMLTYNLANRFAAEGQAIYWATGVFMAVTLLAVGYAFFKQGRLPPMLMVTAVIVTVFGGLTLWLRDDTFIKLKPTIINLLFAGAIFGGLAFRQNVWKMLFEGAFDLPDKVWTIFAVRWGFFYLFLAGLNEVVRLNFSESFWANFKFFGVLPTTVAFMALNLPLLMKHMKPKAPQPDAPPAA